MLKVSMILELVNKLSKPARDAKRDLDKLTGKSGLGGVERIGGNAGRGLDKVGTASERLKAKLSSVAAGVRDLGGKGMSVLHGGAMLAALSIGKLIGSLVRLGVQTAVVGAGIAVFAAGRLVGNILGVGMAMEDASIELERIERSAMKAAIGMDRIKELAGSSTIPMAAITEAYIKARENGINPLAESFTGLMDEAVAAKAELVDVVEAVGKAKRGKFDGLDRFGITASAKKGVVSFMYLDAAGKRATRSVSDNAHKIERVLGEIFKAKSGGAAEAKLKSLSGTIAWLRNQLDLFEVQVGESGFYDTVKAEIGGLVQWMKNAAKDGSLKKWAQELSDNLKKAFNWAKTFVNNVDWERTGAGLKTIAESVAGIVRDLQQLVDWATKAANAINMIPGASIASMASWRDLSPVGTVGSWLGMFGNGRKPAPKVAPTGRGSAAGPSRAGDWTKPLGGPIARPNVKTSSAVDLHNRLAVEISTPAGMQARVTGQQTAANTTLSVSRVTRGPAMAAAA